MISFQTAQRVLRHRLPVPTSAEVSLVQALGRIAVRDHQARQDSPPFDRSVMDGFAVGHAGRALRPVSTGERLTPGTSAVIKVEDARLTSDGHLVFRKPIRRGENMIRRGTHFRKGARLVAKGTSLGAAHIGLLASQGFATVRVFCPPRVALLATGDELAETGARKVSSKIWNASGPMLRSLLTAMGCEVTYLGIGRDDPGVLSEKIRRGLKADVLITTGAVSVGARDHVPALLRRAGVEIYFHRVRMRPGKPLFFGGRGRTLVFGLPGNPVSSLVTFLLFVRPALERLQGKEAGFFWEEGRLAGAAANDSGRLSFLPARLSFRRDAWRVSPLPYAGSADLRAAADADCFFILKEKQVNAPKNTRVKFIRVRRQP